MSNQFQLPPGFRSDAERFPQNYAAAPAPAQPPMPPTQEQFQPPQDYTEYHTRTRWERGVGAVALIGVLAYGSFWITEHYTGQQSDQQTTSTPRVAAKKPSQTDTGQDTLQAFSGNTPTSAPSSAAPLNDKNFKPKDANEADVPLVVNRVYTPVTWVGTLADGTLFKTKPAGAYPGMVEGTATVTAYWNDTSGMKLDQALTDQTHVKTYDIPSDSINYGLDTSQLTNTVMTHPAKKIYKSIREKFGSAATRFAARTLQNHMRDNAKHGEAGTTTIYDINDFHFRQNISRGTILQSIIQQGQAGLEADLKADAVIQGIPAESIDFVFTGDTPPGSLAFAPQPPRPSNRGDVFRYRNKADWLSNIIVQPFVTGGTS
jgi:hypothetical protein